MNRVLLATAVTLATVTLATVTLAITGTALASQCPTEIAKIDDALSKNPQISAEQTAQILKLRAAGEAKHAGGQHAEALAALAEAKAILGLT